MAKITGMRPESSKSRVRISLSAVDNMENLFDQIDKLLPGASVTHGKYMFRIVGFDMRLSGPSSGKAEYAIFGRKYVAYVGTSSQVITYRTTPTEFMGLWHDSTIFKGLADKGTTSALNEMPVVTDTSDTGGDIVLDGDIILDFIPKELKTKE